MYVPGSVPMYVPMHVPMYVPIHVPMYVPMHVPMYESMYVPMYVPMSVYHIALSGSFLSYGFCKVRQMLTNRVKIAKVQEKMPLNLKALTYI